MICNIKKTFNTFISGILISTFMTFPVINASASSTSYGPKSYFNHSVPNLESTNPSNEFINRSYYNKNSITTGKDVANQEYAIAGTYIMPNDGHTYFPGEVKIKVRLYTSDGYQILDSGWFSNTSVDLTGFSIFRTSKNVLPGLLYYSKGITEVFTNASTNSGYTTEHTYISPSLGDFTY